MLLFNIVGDAEIVVRTITDGLLPEISSRVRLDAGADVLYLVAKGGVKGIPPVYGIGYAG